MKYIKSLKDKVLIILICDGCNNIIKNNLSFNKTINYKYIIKNLNILKKENNWHIIYGPIKEINLQCKKSKVNDICDMCYKRIEKLKAFI